MLRLIGAGVLLYGSYKIGRQIFEENSPPRDPYPPLEEVPPQVANDIASEPRSGRGYEAPQSGTDEPERTDEPEENPAALADVLPASRNGRAEP
jgi:hypothetical protein